MTDTGIDTGVEQDHATGWFEACAEHRGPDLDGPCRGCGWLASDHTAGLARVIAVVRPRPAPLRRAS
jgi:hypothetical protein